MKPKFKVGDKVVIKNQKSGLEYLNGVEGTVMHTYVDIMNCRWYRVKTKQGEIERTARELDFAEASPKNTPKFKIGDTVKHQLLGEGQVVGIYPESQVMFYEVKFRDQYNTIDIYPEHFLTLVPNKQTTSRSLSITLDQAKFYYEQGGTLREIALQVFTEEELNPKPKYPGSWEEYCKNHKGKLFYIDELSTICETHDDYYTSNDKNDRNTLPSKELAEAFLAMMQLMSLRQAWIGDWKPVWSGEIYNYCIIVFDNKYFIEAFSQYHRTLSFPTKEMAEDFMKCFKDLLEIAKPLI